MVKKVLVEEMPVLSGGMTAELLGQAIRAKRTQSGLKIEDAAALCGVAKQTYLNLEHGRAGVKLSTVLKVCQQLGVRLFIEAWQPDNVEVDDEWL